MLSFVSASRRALRARRGVAALEFALVGGTFFIMMLAAIDVGRYYMVYQGMRTVIELHPVFLDTHLSEERPER